MDLVPLLDPPGHGAARVDVGVVRMCRDEQDALARSHVRASGPREDGVPVATPCASSQDGSREQERGARCSASARTPITSGPSSMPASVTVRSQAIAMPCKLGATRSPIAAVGRPATTPAASAHADQQAPHTEHHGVRQEGNTGKQRAGAQ